LRSPAYSLTQANFRLNASLGLRKKTQSFRRVRIILIAHYWHTEDIVRKQYLLVLVIFATLYFTNKAFGSAALAFANPSTSGTTTCGVQEAINSLPATGGKVITQWSGTCTATTTITITKPIELEGLGAGGISSEWNISAGAILANGSAGSDLITITLPSGASYLEGVTIHDIALKGNRSIGATAGDNISIVGTSASDLSNIYIDRVTSFGAGGNNLSIQNNAYMIHVSQSQFIYGGGNGISITNGSGGQPSQIHFSQINSSLNTGDGIYVNTSIAADIHAYQSTFADNLNGIYIAASSSASYLDAIGCDFEQNTNAGADLLSMGPNSIINSTFPADGTQQYGIYEDPGSSVNWVQTVLNLMDDSLQTNQTADLYLSSNVHLATIYQQQASKYAGSTLIEDLSNGGARWYTADYLSLSQNGFIVTPPGGSGGFAVDPTGQANASSYAVSGVGGFTGSKTVGSCTLNIQSGIITSVTGC
jgi:hypothetical protein